MHYFVHSVRLPSSTVMMMMMMMMMMGNRCLVVRHEDKKPTKDTFLAGSSCATSTARVLADGIAELRKKKVLRCTKERVLSSSRVRGGLSACFGFFFGTRVKPTVVALTAVLSATWTKRSFPTSFHSCATSSLVTKGLNHEKTGSATDIVPKLPNPRETTYSY